jgi:glycosyltransferase involved in cell wall biosynthesis
MRVLHVYKDFYPPVVGGIEGHINLLCKGLKEKGVDVKVLVSNKKLKCENEIIDGIEVTKAPEIGRCASAPININFSKILRKMASKADLLHFHMPNPTAEASCILSGTGKPIIVTYHSDIIRQSVLKHFYLPFQKLFLDKVKCIIATSPKYIETSDILRKYKNKCHVIPLGIDHKRFCVDYSSQINRIREKYGKRIILFVGRFRYYKGLHVLIDVMKYVDANLLLVGDGELKSELKKRVKKKKLESKIHFLGERSDDEVNVFLKSCDIFVLPSILRSEAFGIVILEAMACGRAVVSTDLGTGTSYVNINDQTGIVVPPRSVRKMAEAFNYLFENPAKIKEFGKNGVTRVRELFSSEKMVNDIIEIYNTTISDCCNNNICINKKIFNPKTKVIRIVSRMNIGGPAVHVSLLLKRLDQTRFDSKLITGTISSLEGDMSYLIEDRKGLVRRIDELQREINPVKDFAAFYKIFRIISTEKPDIVHSHMAKAGTTARLAVGLFNFINSRHKIRIVHTFHGHVLEGYFSETKSKIFKIIERVIASFTDAIIAISRTQRWELISKYRIAKPEKVYTINLGFNLSPFLFSNTSKKIFRKRIGIDDNTILIGIVGRLVPIKNHFMFLKSAKLFLKINPHCNVKFIIIGDGELKNQLKEFANALKMQDKVLFHGWEKNIQEVYSDLDILALTSMNEGTPVSIIEAMASGVPVITTGVGGVKDLLGRYVDETTLSKGFIVCERGMLLKKNDYVGLANGIKFILENKNADRIKNARRFVMKNYSDTNLVKNIEALYETILYKKNETCL